MEHVVSFKCVSDKFEEIPESIRVETGTSFPSVHNRGDEMSKLAKALKRYNKDSLVRLPFCLTVEAEALGAHIKLGDEKNGPRVGDYAFTSIEELKKISSIDFSRGRISEVLRAIESLNNEGEAVALNVQGPFTIMTSLMDPLVFYKAARKDRKAVEDFMEHICCSIVMYVEEAVKRGAKIISFGDSAGSISILGPKMYKDFSGRYSHAVLKSIEEKLHEAVVHICGVTSTSLASGGFIHSNPFEVEQWMTYGEALNFVMNQHKKTKFIGHNCLKRTPAKMVKPVVWRIELV